MSTGRATRTTAPGKPRRASGFAPGGLVSLDFSRASPAMKEAVIVSTARTALAKSVRGGFNITHGAVLGGHAIKHAIANAGIDPAEVEDVFMGCAQPEGATG